MHAVITFLKTSVKMSKKNECDIIEKRNLFEGGKNTKKKEKEEV